VPERADRWLCAAIWKFYRLSQRYSGLNFDPARVKRSRKAATGRVHRRLSGKPDRPEFIEAMTKLRRCVWVDAGSKPADPAGPAACRGRMYDTITAHTSTDVGVTGCAAPILTLDQCYTSIDESAQTGSRVGGGVRTSFASPTLYHAVIRFALGRPAYEDPRHPEATSGCQRRHQREGQCCGEVSLTAHRSGRGRHQPCAKGLISAMVCRIFGASESSGSTPEAAYQAGSGCWQLPPACSYP